MYPRAFEYAIHKSEHVPTTGGMFDVAAWLNELGKDGWQVKEIVQGVEKSGLCTADGEDIPKLVLQALCMRAVFDDEADKGGE